MFKILLYLSLVLKTSPALSKIIQILHTNDLHSYFAGTRGGKGGYAQLKKVADSLKEEAALKEIPTLFLDGGDFGEGSSYYFSHYGVDALRALDLLGIDVTVLGNHDFMLGPFELKDQVHQAKLKTQILSANFKGKKLLGLDSILPSYKDFMFDGHKLRIFGLTTPEIHFIYPLRPVGYISGAVKTGLKEERKALKEGVDFLIALTHLGVEEDIKLARASRSIDLIIGGHSHTLLLTPEIVENAVGRSIPITQVGAHAGYIGAILIDLRPRGESNILEYKIHPVTTDMPQDDEVKAFVERAYEFRKNYFGRDWNEIIGLSEIAFSGDIDGITYINQTCWSRHVAKLTREVIKADIGLQFDNFQGEMIPPGPITFGDMIDNFPHFRRWHDEGWTISTLKISGVILKQVLKALSTSEFGQSTTLDGLTVIGTSEDSKTLNLIPFRLGFHPLRDVLIKGKPIQNGRYYTLALPSEIPFAFLKILNVLTHGVIHKLRTHKDLSYWHLLEDYIKKNSPLRCLGDTSISHK